MRISNRKLYSIIKESIESVLNAGSTTKARKEIQSVIMNCIQDVDDYNDARDSGEDVDPDEHLVSACSQLMDIIRKYRLSPEEYDDIVSRISLPMASKMNFYYYDLKNYLEDATF